ncbi:MAG TPA: ABC transporter permease [Phototrophicaceae bacterium]|nr:ABC transporter permease [Phototrophicaceae bacterium]
MSAYILRRTLQLIPTLFGITILSFLLIITAPGDPIAMVTFNPNSTPESTAILRRQLGLDQPPLVQYFYWLFGNDFVKIDVNGDGVGDVQGTRKGVLRGDLGQSISYKQPVLDLIVQRIPATLELTLSALIVGYVVGIPLGLFAAINHRRAFDQVSRVISVLGNAVPSFWLALLLIILFSVRLGWLPMAGMSDVTDSGPTTVAEALRYMLLPVFVLSVGTVAGISRYVRASTLEILEQDYVRTAQAKGLKSRTIWWKHVVRNALIPVATFLGPALGSLLGGAVIIEDVFSWPGLGRLAVNAAFARDYPLVMGFVLVGGVLYIIGVLFSDILYAWLDPRVQLR